MTHFLAKKYLSIFCYVFSITLQPILTKFSDFNYYKICRKITFHILVITSSPEIFSGLYFCLFTIFLKKYRRWTFKILRDGKKCPAAVPFAYPNACRHFRLSREGNEKTKTFLNFFKYLFVKFDINALTNV